VTARFVAERWHGPSARTWRLARGGAVAALLAPVVLWLGKGPLCAIAGVEKVDPGSQACSAAASLPFSLTTQVVGLIGVIVVGGGLLVWQLVRLDRSIRHGADSREAAAASRRIVVTGLLAVSGSGRSLRRACSKSPMPRRSARARRSIVRTRRRLAGDDRTADGRWSGSASLGARCPELDADPSQAHFNALRRV
jgi:hypothetical protein